MYVNAKAELVTLAPGLRPLARGLSTYLYLLTHTRKIWAGGVRKRAAIAAGRCNNRKKKGAVVISFPRKHSKQAESAMNYVYLSP